MECGHVIACCFPLFSVVFRCFPLFSVVFRVAFAVVFDVAAVVAVVAVVPVVLPLRWITDKEFAEAAEHKAVASNKQ